jgi:hypothetical protein
MLDLPFNRRENTNVIPYASGGRSARFHNCTSSGASASSIKSFAFEEIRIVTPNQVLDMLAISLEFQKIKLGVGYGKPSPVSVLIL